MVGEYPIFFAGEEKGIAVVTRQGMFWYIRCSCQCCEELGCSVIVSWTEDQCVDLGRCFREEDRWCLSTRIRRNAVPEGKPVFRMMIKNAKSAERLVPIQPEEPFAYLSRLKNAYLVRLPEGNVIALGGQTEISSPTGQ